MQYQKLPCVRNPVSRIVFGTAVAPMLEGGDNSEMLDAAYRAGINAFDTAAGYGLSEVSLGDWLRSRKLYEKAVILTKGAHPDGAGKDRLTPRDIESDFAQSQDRLKTKFVDIYMLHRDDLEVEVGPIVETLNRLHRRGEIGAFGGSNWTIERIAQANDYAERHGLVPFTVSSPNFGLADQIGDPWGQGAGCVTISGPRNAVARDWYRASNMPVFAYSSLGRGMFSGRVKSAEPEGAKDVLDPAAVKGYCYPENFRRLARVERLAAEKGRSVPELAISWIFRQSLNVFAIVSTSNRELLSRNCAALDIELTERECDWMDLGSESLG